MDYKIVLMRNAEYEIKPYYASKHTQLPDEPDFKSVQEL